jgi:glucokinase
MSYFVGIEIGGTKLQFGIGDGVGTELRAFERLPARAAGGAGEIRGQIEGAIPRLLEEAGMDAEQIAGVGIGFGGPVRADLATVTRSHQVEGWGDFPLAEWIQEVFGWRSIVHNDADTAALAEARFGAGKGYNPVFYITIGSGIGGGLVIDGKIYRGCGAGASEIGHMRVPPWVPDAAGPYADGVDWITAESICSGWSIARRAREAIAAGEASVVAGLAGTQEEITAQTIADAARQGDPLACRLVDETWRVLAVPVAQVITLLCPQRVVIGGGVSLMGEELLFEGLRREVARLVFRPFAESYELVPAALGEKVVLYGALALAREAFA